MTTRYVKPFETKKTNSSSLFRCLFTKFSSILSLMHFFVSLLNFSLLHIFLFVTFKSYHHHSPPVKPVMTDRSPATATGDDRKHPGYWPSLEKLVTNKDAVLSPAHVRALCQFLKIH